MTAPAPDPTANLPGTETGTQFKTYLRPPCTHGTKAIGEKCEECEAWGLVYGATSFGELDAGRAAANEARAVNDVMADFRIVVDAIMYADLTPQEKAGRLDAATAELATRIENPPERKSLREKIADLFKTDEPAPEPAPPPGTSISAEGGAFKVFKGADGSDRWLAVYSNDLYDRDEEVIPAGEHARFIKQADESGAYPELWTWHTPGTRLGVADVLDLTSEGFAMAGGLFDTGKEAAVKALAGMDALGVSHGFSYQSKTAAGEILGYRTFEISPLPIARAANPHTGFLVGDTDMEGLMSLTPEKKAFLTDVHGPEFVAGLETSLSKAAATAAEKGISFKDLIDELVPTPAPAEPPVPVPAAVAEGAGGAGEAAAIVTAVPGVLEAIAPVVKALGEVAERLTLLEAGKAAAGEPAPPPAAKSIEEQVAEKVAEAMTPKNGVFVASLAKDTQIHGNDADAKAVKAGGDSGIPEHQRDQFALLADVTRTTPQQLAQVVNPGGADNNDGGGA